MMMMTMMMIIIIIIIIIIITDEEHTDKVKRQWSQKALHCRHPYDLSQQYVDMEASNKWLTRADLFAETEGFLTAMQDQVISTRN
jgi:sensor histidine kinase regulating citrate/malate metabolism